MTALDKYRRMRDFARTSEPKGAEVQKPLRTRSGLFVVHKHAARRLHYDLRLAHNGVLWSWAVTRGPSLDPAQKRLAVHVEDHPFEYAKFEGTIPKGGYGAGEVIIWDKGQWTPQQDPDLGMQKGHLSFALAGEKLGGLWNLVRLKSDTSQKHDNWLLIKVADDFARTGGDVLEEHPNSVKSGKSIKDLQISTPAKKQLRISKALSNFIAPALARLQPMAPLGPYWQHEVKLDGYRIQSHLANGKVTLYSRSGLDWTKRFGPRILDAIAALRCRTAILDGEIVVLENSGVTSFSALQNDLSKGRTDRMVFFVFDCLHVDGKSLIDEPLSMRKAALTALLTPLEPESAVRLSEEFAAEGNIVLAHACRMGLEGVVSKRRDAPYHSGRSESWVKSKCTLRQEFIIAGYLPSEAKGRGIKSLLVAYKDNRTLRYAGRVGTGLTAKSSDDLKRKLDKIRTTTSTVAGITPAQKKAVWVKPRLVADIEFRTWTKDRLVRQGSFKGLREDKSATDVVDETKVAKTSPLISIRGAGKGQHSNMITLGNPQKLLWPAATVSKKMLLDHYEAVWPRMESHVVERPLSLVRAPDGVDGPRFFQKHASAGMGKSIHVFADPTDGEELIYIKDFSGIADLVQAGTVEIHLWGAQISNIEKPDQIVFDLDPDPSVELRELRAAALEIKDKLDELGFANFVKTSGGKGFHIVVPLKPRSEWPEVKTFAHDFADAMVQQNPDTYTATLSKKARTGRIFIDYLRNARGATTVAPYSSRAHAQATISVPVTWQALKRDVTPTTFAITSSGSARFIKQADPWAKFFSSAKVLR